MKKMSKTRNKENLLPFHIIKACGDGCLAFQGNDR